MASIMKLPFVAARIPLLNIGTSTDANARKHSEDRTTSVIRKWATLRGELQAARGQTMNCLEATEGKGGAVVLKIADKPRFDRLQQTIADHQEQIASLEEAIRKLDDLIQANALGSGYLQDLQHRLSSSSGSIYQQKSNITKWLTFHTQKNPRMPPEDVLKLPEFVAKRAEAEKIIKADEAYLAKFKPVADEIEGILASVGC